MHHIRSIQSSTSLQDSFTCKTKLGWALVELGGPYKTER